MAHIHPTAIVSPQAELADDVEVGAYCIVEADVRIGAGTVLRPHAVVRRFTQIGEGNFVDSFSVLGSEPQDTKFDPASETYLHVGDRNRFREHVTISRATNPGGHTRVGSDTFWMAGAHAGHEATIGDGVVLANCASIGGHATVGARCFLSACAGVHQFCWVGEGVMMRGHGGASTHVPPFLLVEGINNAAGLNIVGMRRTPSITEQDRDQVREAYRLFFRSGLPVAAALQQLDARDGWGPPARRFIEFIHRARTAEKPFNRPLIRTRR